MISNVDINNEDDDDEEGDLSDEVGEGMGAEKRVKRKKKKDVSLVPSAKDLL